MKRTRLSELVALATGTMLLSGCFSNGAAYFDSKCSSFSGASVSKKYYIEEFEVDGDASFLEIFLQKNSLKLV